MLKITAISPNITAKRGDNVNLTCSGVGQDSLNISWVTPSGEVVYTSSYDTGESGFSWAAQDFVIANVTASDGGVYTCTAVNEEGSVNASVVVYVTPYFTTQLTDILTTNGTNETVSCSAEGFPPPDIQWVASKENYTQLEGDFISETCNEGCMLLGNNETNETLTFYPVVFGDEEYIYYCLASNEHGDIHSSFQVISKFVISLSTELQIIHLSILLKS